MKNRPKRNHSKKINTYLQRNSRLACVKLDQEEGFWQEVYISLYQLTPPPPPDDDPLDAPLPGGESPPWLLARRRATAAATAAVARKASSCRPLGMNSA
jgi:hypothetical protein